MLKGIKRAIGAASGEEYYEQAMLGLGKAPLKNALSLFEQAARKAADEGKHDLQHRARAQIALHQFIESGDLEALRAAASSLSGAGWIERPGSPTERVPADPLIAEIEGRLLAAGLDDASSDELARTHQEAADAFARCMDHRLVTYPHHHGGDDHVDLGRSRHLFHAGMAGVHTAKILLNTSPDEAGKALGRAITSFAGCGNEEWQERCMARLKRIQTRRTCWVCHREFPGEGDYYDSVAAHVTDFVVNEASRTGKDTSSIDVQRGSVVLCRVCESIIEARVSARVDGLRELVRYEVAQQVAEAMPPQETR